LRRANSTLATLFANMMMKFFTAASAIAVASATFAPRFSDHTSFMEKVNKEVNKEVNKQMPEMPEYMEEYMQNLEKYSPAEKKKLTDAQAKMGNDGISDCVKKYTKENIAEVMGRMNQGMKDGKSVDSLIESAKAEMKKAEKHCGEKSASTKSAVFGAGAIVSAFAVLLF